MRDVYVIGSYSTQFKKWPEKTFKDLTRDAYLGVLQDAKMDNGDEIQFATVMFKMRCIAGSLRADGIETTDVTWMTSDEILALNADPILKNVHRTVLAHLDDGTFIV